MSLKLPALKGLVSSSQDKRRLRRDLSVEMIGAPLGDFRHTMHVGRGGDVFGDTSFLSSYGGPSRSLQSESRPVRLLSRTLQQVRRVPAPARARAGSRDAGSPPPFTSPLIKNAISLPQLNLCGGGALTLSTACRSPGREICSYALHSGFLSLPRSSAVEQSSAERAGSPQSSGLEDSEVSLTRSDSLSSFTVDLGPSLMSEVLELIDGTGPREPREEDQDQDLDLDQDQQESGSETALSRAADVAMEPRRFRQAASVLARHFGGARAEEQKRPSSFRLSRTPFSFTETEEEIKV